MKQPPSFGASTFYLFYLFPTGICNFIITIVGLVLSIGFMPLFIGFPMLLVWLHGVKLLNSIDARLARRLLALDTSTNSPTSSITAYPSSGLWRKLSELLSDPGTYTAIIWQIARLPVGILAFTVAVTVISVEIALVSTPIVYWVLLQTIHINIFEDHPLHSLLPQSPLLISFIFMGIGLLLLPVAVKFIRSVAYLFGQFAVELDSTGSN
ncbi:sensor domain-containing protein [Paenibacillus sp. RC67]|uniref:sensor domain-containing protein n=1 Tax=Paenibacillus sp. RC67 TaxID=3039392 RepID=UPI0024AE2297|nr:sensor domain-containing protein [Paenibacillus sp. RC67]